MTTAREEAEHDRAIAVKALRAAADAWTMGEWIGDQLVRQLKAVAA